ncbi:phosphomannomutase [Pseudocolwellia agarivorans]|uniref:phosphomannomutase n=1 Tax=Pseudocolwellia agarivorans TaxID=1911682 RepID=UPI000986C163|nr:phosphomannomutase [Pseudocolwellia agarivorans]
MSTLQANTVLENSGIAFGTSGARGLVEQFTPDVCAAFSLAFIDTLKGQFTFDCLAIAIDNRPSSYAMAQACSAALKQQGIEIIYYGVIPTPALAYAAMERNIPCIMVTGSHIPFDRNGLKFYRPDGEISKSDELSILKSEAAFEPLDTLDELEVSSEAGEEYVLRYSSLFDQPFLTGKHIGIYEHSSAGRDLYQALFEELGAKVTSLERSDEFVPIDTEAVSEEDQLKAINWSKEYGFDAIYSTDGDGDRPLIADEKGVWLRGDILGLLCAKQLNVEALSIPVNSNTSIELSNAFKKIERTRIGSPYVIAEFEGLSKSYKSVAGFEANGGFLLGTDTSINGKVLKALPTRDALLPAIMLLAGTTDNKTISDLVKDCTKRFSASDRIKNFATAKSKQLIETYAEDASALIKLLGFADLTVTSIDVTDGLRMTLSDNDVIHLRPSGNAPELRCYAESTSDEKAKQLVVQVLGKVVIL